MVEDVADAALITGETVVPVNDLESVFDAFSALESKWIRTYAQKEKHRRFHLAMHDPDSQMIQKNQSVVN